MGYILVKQVGQSSVNTTMMCAKLERWEAWAPGIEAEHEWRQWAENKLEIRANTTPDVSFLPALFRRRLSRLSKMMLNVAFRCMSNSSNSEQHIYSVFCSRHGDLATTMKLLQGITEGQLISPTGFSMSVHNTASGLYTIAREDQLPSSAIASGEDSLGSGFLEAMALLSGGITNRVLLVVGDEPVPPPYSECFDEMMSPHAAAFLLSTVSDTGPCLGLSVEPNQHPYEGSIQEPHALSLLRWLIKQDSELRLTSRRLTWCWKASIEEV